MSSVISFQGKECIGMMKSWQNGKEEEENPLKHLRSAPQHLQELFEEKGIFYLSKLLNPNAGAVTSSMWADNQQIISPTFKNSSFTTHPSIVGGLFDSLEDAKPRWVNEHMFLTEEDYTLALALTERRLSLWGENDNWDERIHLSHDEWQHIKNKYPDSDDQTITLNRLVDFGIKPSL